MNNFDKYIFLPVGIIIGFTIVMFINYFHRTAEIGCWQIRVEDEKARMVTCIYPALEIGKARTFDYDCSLGWHMSEAKNGEQILICRKFYRTLHLYKVDMNPDNIIEP